MLITSNFNPKGLRLQLALYMLAPLMLMTFSLGSRWEVLVSVVGAGVLTAAGLCVWAFRLKTITVAGDELEVKHTCLPFLKRYHRLAEFDAYIIEEEGVNETLCLLIQGKPAVKLSSKIYGNYAELKEVLSVVGQKEWGTDSSRAVDSKFSWSHIAAVFILFLFVLTAVAIPVAEYFEEGEVTWKSGIPSLASGLVFVPLFLYALSCSKRLTVWRGHLEVRSLLCPWRTDRFALDDFDFSLEVVTPSHFEEDKSLWLVCDNKLAVSIQKNIYANYFELEHALGIEPRDTIQMSYFKKLRYHLGEVIN